MSLLPKWFVPAGTNRGPVSIEDMDKFENEELWSSCRGKLQSAGFDEEFELMEYLLKHRRRPRVTSGYTNDTGPM